MRSRSGWGGRPSIAERPQAASAWTRCACPAWSRRAKRSGSTSSSPSASPAERRWNARWKVRSIEAPPPSIAASARAAAACSLDRSAAGIPRYTASRSAGRVNRKRAPAGASQPVRARRASTRSTSERFASGKACSRNSVSIRPPATARRRSHRRSPMGRRRNESAIAAFSEPGSGSSSGEIASESPVPSGCGRASFRATSPRRSSESIPGFPPLRSHRTCESRSRGAEWWNIRSTSASSARSSSAARSIRTRPGPSARRFASSSSRSGLRACAPTRSPRTRTARVPASLPAR
jgi:hypothetical protein